MREGRDIVIVSSNLPDRLLVLQDGSLAAPLTSAETTPDEVLSYTAGFSTSTKKDVPVSGQKLNKRKEQP
jgi:ABC-type sugar transport system ATPase subunit